MGSKAFSQKKFMRILTAPIRALGKARDFYIRSITDCANHTTYGRAGALGSDLPRSFSTSSYGSTGSEDLRELIRANTTSGAGITKADLELFIQQEVAKMKQQQQQQLSAGRKVPRSVSVGMGRIDEEGSVSSRDDENSVGKNMTFPRSKTYAVGSAAFI